MPLPLPLIAIGTLAVIWIVVTGVVFPWRMGLFSAARRRPAAPAPPTRPTRFYTRHPSVAGTRDSARNDRTAAHEAEELTDEALAAALIGWSAQPFSDPT